MARYPVELVAQMARPEDETHDTMSRDVLASTIHRLAQEVMWHRWHEDEIAQGSE